MMGAGKQRERRTNWQERVRSLKISDVIIRNVYFLPKNTRYSLKYKLSGPINDNSKTLKILEPQKHFNLRNIFLDMN